MSRLQKFLDDDPTLLKEITAEEFETVENINNDKKVSIGVLEQVMWERDVAIDQLKELGYGLGQKIEKLTDGDRAVSLNAVKETLCSMCDEWRCNENCSKKREFDKLPSVSQIKKGHWIKKPYLEPLPMDCLPPASEDYDEETGIMTVSQRNRFYQGEEIEIISPIDR